MGLAGWPGDCLWSFAKSLINLLIGNIMTINMIDIVVVVQKRKMARTEEKRDRFDMHSGCVFAGTVVVVSSTLHLN